MMRARRETIWLVLAIACAVALALLMLASPLRAEEFEVRFDSGCADLPLAKVDFAFEWVQDGVEISEPAGVTVTAQPGDTTYTVSGLPDVAAGVGTRYSVTFEACDVVGIYAWPQQTRTPQSVVFRGTFEPSGTEIRRGDTLPKLSLLVTGLAADPTGSTVTFSMSKDRGGAATIDGAAAVLSDIDQAADLTWQATATYSWSTSDTTAAGRFHGWFEITFAVADCGPAANEACVSTWPPDRDIGVRVY